MQSHPFSKKRTLSNAPNTGDGYQSQCMKAWQMAIMSIGVTFGFRLAAMAGAALRIPSQTITIPYRAVFLLFSLSMLLKFRRVISASFSKSYAMKAFLVFWILYSIRLLLDLYISPPPELRLEKTQYLQLAYGVALIPALCFAARFNLPSLKIVRRYFCIFGLVTVSISTILFRDFIRESIGRISVESTDIAYGSLNTSYTASALAVVGLYVLITQRTTRNTLMGGLILTTAIIPLALGASRGPIIAIFICFIAAVYGSYRRGRLAWPSVIIVLFICSIPTAIDVFAMVGSKLMSRFEILLYSDLGEANARIGLWIDAWQQFVESPLIGSGLEEQHSLFYPHNIVMEGFMATGIAGGCALLVFIVGCIHASARILCAPMLYDSAGWFAILFLHYLVFALFSGALFSNVEFWAFGVAVLSVQRYSAFSFREPRVNKMTGSSY